MEKEVLIEIDNLILKIKHKIDTNGMVAADMFIITTLEILRAELSNNSSISDLTIGACQEIKSTTSHFYYYRDFPILYKELQNSFQSIFKIDSRFHSADTPLIGFNVLDWLKYINKANNDLLSNLPMNPSYRKNN